MARGNDPGRDFDRQFGQNKARGDAKAARGEGPWAQDKYLRDGAGTGSGGGDKDNSGCGDKTVVLLAALGGIAWAVSEFVQKVA